MPNLLVQTPSTTQPSKYLRVHFKCSLVHIRAPNMGTPNWLSCHDGVCKSRPSQCWVAWGMAKIQRENHLRSINWWFSTLSKFLVAINSMTGLSCGCGNWRTEQTAFPSGPSVVDCFSTAEIVDSSCEKNMLMDWGIFQRLCIYIYMKSYLMENLIHTMFWDSLYAWMVFPHSGC